MYYSLNSLNGGSGSSRRLLQELLQGILSVWTIAHIGRVYNRLPQYDTYILYMVLMSSPRVP